MKIFSNFSAFLENINFTDVIYGWSLRRARTYFIRFFCVRVWGQWVRVVHKVLRETKWVLDSNHTGLQCILYVLGASNGKILHGMRGNLHVKDATQLFQILPPGQSKVITHMYWNFHNHKTIMVLWFTIQMSKVKRTEVSHLEARSF